MYISKTGSPKQEFKYKVQEGYCKHIISLLNVRGYFLFHNECLLLKKS